MLLIPQKNRLFAYLVKKSLIRSQLVTADSQAMIEVMQTLVSSKEKYKHIQYGIELVDSLVKEKIIYSNRLHNPLYRIDQIIEYFSEIVIDYPQWQLVIAGEGSETKTLKKLVESKGIVDKVNFVGWQTLEENNRWYGKSSIYISIPESDGTAVSLLEAMSAGCVPIVPNLEVSKEWITDLKTGIIETGGMNPLLSAMILDINECGKENRMMVEQKAVKSFCTKKFIEFYKSLSNEA